MHRPFKWPFFLSDNKEPCKKDPTPELNQCPSLQQAKTPLETAASLPTSTQNATQAHLTETSPVCILETQEEEAELPKEEVAWRYTVGMFVVSFETWRKPLITAVESIDKETQLISGPPTCAETAQRLNLPHLVVIWRPGSKFGIILQVIE